MSNTALQKEVQNLQSDIASIKDILEAKAEDAVSDNNVTSISREDIKSALNNAGRSVGEFVNTKRDQAAAATKSTEKAIVKNPFKSAAIAFGAGVIISAILKK